MELLNVRAVFVEVKNRCSCLQIAGDLENFVIIKTFSSSDELSCFWRKIKCQKIKILHLTKKSDRYLKMLESKKKTYRAFIWKTKHLLELKVRCILFTKTLHHHLPPRNFGRPKTVNFSKKKKVLFRQRFFLIGRLSTLFTWFGPQWLFPFFKIKV